MMQLLMVSGTVCHAHYLSRQSCSFSYCFAITFTLFCAQPVGGFTLDERPSGQIVVTGALPSPPWYTLAFVFIVHAVHSVQYSLCSSIFYVDVCQLALLHFRDRSMAKKKNGLCNAPAEI